MAAGFSREVARRIFAEELRSSDLSFRDGEDQHQYAPQYLLTPTGAKCNRVFFVGTLTERDDIGGDTEYWRGRLVDPTASILIYAGQYQPEAAQELASIEPPAFVAVVGKPNLYQTEDGTYIVSIRSEAIQRADESTRNRWILETAERTYERLQILESAALSPLSGNFSTADKVPSSPALDIERAKLHYNTDIRRYKQMVLRALQSLKEDLQGSQPKPSEVNLAGMGKAVEDRDDLDPDIAQLDISSERDRGPVKIKHEGSRKTKPKSSAAKETSLSTFPDQGEKEDVETIPMFKKG